MARQTMERTMYAIGWREPKQVNTVQTSLCTEVWFKPPLIQEFTYSIVKSEITFFQQGRNINMYKPCARDKTVPGF